jgi:cytochrome c peroxidase
MISCALRINPHKKKRVFHIIILRLVVDFKTMKKIYTIFLVLLSSFAVAEDVVFSAEQLTLIKSMSPLPELPLDPTNKLDGNKKAIQLGEAFFNDWRFSRGEEFACATCHRETDHFTTSRTDTDVEIPTLYNMAYNKWFFWDGRADTLWSQSLGPIEAGIEHDFSRTEVAVLMSSDFEYKPAYEKFFGPIPDFSDPDRFPQPGKPSSENAEANKNWLSMTKEDQFEVNKVFANFGKILAAYQTQLVSPKTKFDVYVEGLKKDDSEKMSVLSTAAKRGLKVFVGKGQCITCHSGPNFSDNSFHDMRLPIYTEKKGIPGARAAGVAKVKESIFSANGPFSDSPHSQHLDGLQVQAGDEYKIKTPTLRFISATPPYMHTGQFRFLSDVIDFYSEMKGARAPVSGIEPEMRPRNFTDDEKKDLLEFLKCISERP